MIAARDVSSNWKTIPWNRVFGGEIVADRLFLRSALIRKDLLPRYCPAHAPVTHALASAAEAAAVEAAGASAPTCLNPSGLAYATRWVVKPSDSSNAFGVRFCEKDAGALEACVAGALALERDACWVAQACVPSLPLLARGHKFHLRCLVLFAGDLEVFVYDDARVLIAPVPMDDPGDHAHVTNRSFNKEHAAYVAATHNVALGDCAALGDGAAWGDRGGALKQVRAITATLAKALVAHAADMAAARGAAAAGDAARAAGAEAAGDAAEAAGDAAGAADAPPPPPPGAGKKPQRHFFALPNAYELFGFDFMVDDGMRVVLLEANPEPSMDMWGKTKGEILRGKCPVTDGVPRSDERTGFTKVYSKRFEAALAMMREEKRRAKAAAAAAAP